MSDSVDLLALSRTQLRDMVGAIDKPYRADQIYRWLYATGVRSLDEMTNLPKSLREQLASFARIRPIRECSRQQASDGTVKILFELSSGRRIETVLIPDFDDDGIPGRLTVCVSSQVGCAMGCSFCATGLMGFQQNLTSGEIFDQVRFMNDLTLEAFDKRVTNVVFMGMGEPLLNYEAILDAVEKLTAEDGLGMAARRITVSTVGLARRIRQLADDETSFNLAVSLHSPFDAKRSSIMPVNRKARTDLTALMESIEYYTRETGRRVTYEYCMFKDFNDSEADAAELAKLASRAPSKINLIMYNPVEGLGFTRSSERKLNAFIRKLVDGGARVTVRRSRGQDIDAACGQLAVKTASPEPSA